MPQLLLCREAEEELDALYDIDEDVAALFDFLIEELAEDQQMLDRLCVPDNHFKYAPPFNVDIFQEARKMGLNVYRVKVRKDDGSLVLWRMFVGFHSQKDIYYVLSVTDREFAYDTSHPSFRALVQRYEYSGIPYYR